MMLCLADGQEHFYNTLSVGIIYCCIFRTALLAPGIFQTPRSTGLDPKMAAPVLES